MSFTIMKSKLITFLILTITLSACSNSASNNTIDPYEKLNRNVFAFNDTLDNLLVKPVAQAYKAATPKFVDDRIGNFFGNLGDVGNAINNVMQFKLSDAVADTERFVMNSTFGFAGLLDVASAAGIDKHDEDFGQTLAKWGVQSGPYVMLPILGSSTLRDSVAKITVDRVTDPSHYSDESISLFVFEKLKIRSDFLGQEAILKDLSDDQYSALRGVWLQNRNSLILDGQGNEDAGSDMIDELESLDLE